MTEDDGLVGEEGGARALFYSLRTYVVVIPAGRIRREPKGSISGWWYTGLKIDTSFCE